MLYKMHKALLLYALSARLLAYQACDSLHDNKGSRDVIRRVIARVRPPSVLEKSGCTACLSGTSLEVVSQV